MSGTVQDEKGIPLAVANIIEKGTKNGGQTDFDGKFSIELNNNNATLVASYVGFITKEIVVNGQTNLNISLAEDFEGLD